MSRPSEHTFTPSRVDEQIESLLAARNHTPAEQASQRVLQRVQQLYPAQRDEHTPSLERVWQRVLAAEGAEHQAPGAQTTTRPGGVLSSGPAQARRTGGRARSRPLLAQLAAVLALAMLVAGFLLLSSLAPHKQPLLQTGVSRPGLYAYQAGTIYRLDSQTHQVMWKHTFAHEQILTGGGPVAEGPDQPFVSAGIIFVSTQAQTGGPGKRSLSALNAATGALLWQQPSARAFANQTTVYTLVESQTLAESTLTARDARSGTQLWQRQYPLVGSKNDPAFGTNATEGFRLIAVSDHLLYAVAAYRQQGQNFFARYGLSPADGSILWHTQEALDGRIPLVEARIVNGVVYTTEYNLQPVPPHVDAHGISNDQIPQVRVGAYDLATGRQRWRTAYLVGEQPNGSFDLLVSGDLLYFQTFNNQWLPTAPHPQATATWYALNARDGTLRWRYQSKGEGGMTDAALMDNDLYIEVSTIDAAGTRTGLQIHIVALDGQTGKVRWSTPVRLLTGSEQTPTPVPGSIDPGASGAYAVDMAPVAIAGTVYYSTPGQRIYALQASNGRILSQFRVDISAQTTVLNRLVLLAA